MMSLMCLSYLAVTPKQRTHATLSIAVTMACYDLHVMH